MMNYEEIRVNGNMPEVVYRSLEGIWIKVGFCFENGYLKILSSMEPVDLEMPAPGGCEKCDANYYEYKDAATGNCVEIQTQPFKFMVKDRDNNIICESFDGVDGFLVITTAGQSSERKIRLSFKTGSRHYFGFGERYNRLNQEGLNPDILVFEQFTNQQKTTYMPIPFFLTEKGYGMYLNSSFYMTYGLSSTYEDLLQIEAKVNDEKPYLDLYIFFGQPKEVIRSFLGITGYPVLPPKWSFGPWMSSNRWNTQTETIRQVELTQKYEIPATVLVLEAWSDEATFYIFNDGEYKVNKGDQGFRYEEFSFKEDGKWPDPKGMADYIHDHGLKLILWQIPVIKHFETVEIEQHARDEEYAIVKGYCVRNADGTPYRIPDNWFARSLVFDFTNPEAREWWLGKRKYLLESLKVDGFKTDGGEFIYDEETCFHDGRKGDEMRNFYPVSYISAYHDFIGKERVTFSRAGYTGAQKYPLYWAGDQESTFAELKSVLTAGLSINLSGNPFWSFDIAGFSGKMPTAELYIRSTQLAAFCPVMQFHSAPAEGTENNDRTPWNVSEYNNDWRVLEIYRKYANLRMSLLPYIYSEAVHVAESGEPFMRHLMIDYPRDPRAYDIHDQYLFGRNLLIAPITEAGSRQRWIYLPEGEWVDFWDGTKYCGSKDINYSCDIDRIPVFMKNHSVLPLNLNKAFELGGSVGNKIDGYKNLCFLITGIPELGYVFSDDLGNRVFMESCQKGTEVKILGKISSIYLLKPYYYTINNLDEIIKLNDMDCCLSEVRNEGEACG